MKQTALAILAFAVVLAAFYFVFSFIAWDANPQNWTGETRLVLAWFGFSAGGMAAVFVFAQTDKH
jgi:uncharacterized membrane protein YidH (DUF202 family)